MELKSNHEVLNSQLNLPYLSDTLDEIKNLIRRAKNSLVREIPIVGYLMRENDQLLTDLIFNDKTLSVRYYQTFAGKAEQSYLLFAILDGYIDNEGESMPSNPGRIIDIGRYDIILNENDVSFWRDQDNQDDVFSTGEITDHWIAKFRNEVLNELELREIIKGIK